MVKSGDTSNYEVLLGRLWDEEGAHCREGGMNRRALGVCLVGNFDEAPPPRGQWEAAVRLVRWMARLYEVPVERVVGHRDYAPYKTCPGRAFSLEAFRRAIWDGDAGPLPT